MNIIILVPMLCVGTKGKGRSAPDMVDAERPVIRSHAERGNEENTIVGTRRKDTLTCVIPVLV